MEIVKQSIPKVDGLELVLGKPVYTDDIAPNNALIVKILRSPHAFAKIKAIDTSRAEKLAGVECILTYKDLPRVPITRAGQSYPEPSTYDKYILDEYVRHVGDEVAIIAAINEKIATKAMKLIKVDYEVFEPVLDFETAEGHPSIIHPKWQELHSNFDVGFQPSKNIACTYEIVKGDVEETLKGCQVVVKETYYSQGQAHIPMETHRSFSYLDHQGRLVIVSSSQIVYHVRRTVARALGLPISKIRVIKPRLGGGYGAKQTIHCEYMVAAVTMKTGKAAKLVYSRQEVFEATTTRHPMKLEVTVGATSDGTIKAIDIKGLADTGAYGEHAWTVFGVSGSYALPLYNKVDAARFHGKVVYTNHVTSGAFRGYGATQGIYALESAVNELAKKLGMDPTLVRKKNAITKGETQPAYITNGAEGFETFVNSCELGYCVTRGMELIGWEEKYPRQAISSNKVRGIGMAIAKQGSGISGIDMASATIKLNEDGVFTLLISSADMGTGCDTILSQIAAEALEVSFDKIVVYSADTDVTPFDSGSYASSTTYVTGNAIKLAAEKMKQSIIDEGAKKLGVEAEQALFDGESIRTKDGNSISLSELASKLLYDLETEKNQLVVTCSFTGEQSPPPYMAGFAEVEVDLETGKVEVLNYAAVVDCGTPINPNLARTQVEGGVVQSIGLALYEEVKYNQKGKLITNNLMQYKIPSRRDIGNVTVEFAESYEPSGPFGAKSIGEIVVNTPAPAIQDAIYNAVGVRIRSLPITPEKILMALKEKKN